MKEYDEYDVPEQLATSATQYWINNLRYCYVVPTAMIGPTPTVKGCGVVPNLKIWPFLNPMWYWTS